MEYPKVKHKLPELFDIIIDVDKYRELLRKLSVIPLDDVRQNKLCRQEQPKNTLNVRKVLLEVLYERVQNCN